ncbi:hypothetical protein OAL01_00170 [Rubripirellula sp.]|nr:hypothetical protein [Rubripirellula sp.]
MTKNHDFQLNTDDYHQAGDIVGGMRHGNHVNWNVPQIQQNRNLLPP